MRGIAIAIMLIATVASADDGADQRIVYSAAICTYGRLATYAAKQARIAMRSHTVRGRMYAEDRAGNIRWFRHAQKLLRAKAKRKNWKLRNCSDELISEISKCTTNLDQDAITDPICDDKAVSMYASETLAAMEDADAPED